MTYPASFAGLVRWLVVLSVTFLVLPRKVTKRSRPRFAAPAGCPALLVWSGGCGTRTACSNITSDLAGVVCQLSRMASCFISARRNPLTSLRYSVADEGDEKRKPKTQNPKPKTQNH